ncbi:LEAF RUST 10 DISEASE-RESISTANCE LOCUS RECEPTOR-LIKE PROTEIN KINASE-like 2.7 isoform X2 [Brassica napus]|uniref:LEAF RUST 10 DISEASE-RESISTANCE LOCUS RECEPTOR-LIKE PROTEIN KINASE-like 2.7 isoform X2 n=1 Tax=Brassica napus TaxID=3708 RepID=UPI002078EBAF|nr:LEAF RUST 10 DISEASE-RESISTANCE LOCUS RECEPTOR-LIKE PROTEIN KINASE-like 2.7 isoform X2 [Brassica napus]XP_048629556.1 LEAF RUST 10 DISEASE-RESISTANCE LOCUS RECEPTOR-LIKE PROTEIN KINASE-like 2.7 isoform X2 [Brassica napus]
MKSLIKKAMRIEKLFPFIFGLSRIKPLDPLLLNSNQRQNTHFSRMNYPFSFCLILFAIFSSFSHLPGVSSAGELYRLCSKTFSCCDQVRLSYPFWKPGRKACGHPEFELNCSGDFAELNISTVKFRIIDSGYYETTLIRTDYIDNLYPRNPLNAQFNENVVSFPYNTELVTIYYDCPNFSPLIPHSFYVGELVSGNNRRNYYVTKNLTSPLLEEIRGLLNNFREMCKRNVSIPASGSALETLQRSPNTYNLKKAIEQGFDLYVNSDCERCMVSEGACGYNQTSSAFVCYCKDGPHNSSCPTHNRLCSLTGIIALVVLLCPCFGVQIFRKRKTSDDRRQKKLKALIPLKHYTYAQVKKITKSFAEVVGRGGFGVVYRGTLCDGRMVAVKVLKDSKDNNGEDFINEVASMSQTSHVNIVSLLGFCSEGSKRAIIYEFLENGSLDKFISDTTIMNLDFTALYDIALGVARGLEYLHFGCKTRIVHFDIKPQNVLLDENLLPKVSDFGLAKLCEKKESIISLLDMRGTIGYIAPEMFSPVYGSVSHKSDVYSYGMLLLEMIGARKKEIVDQVSASNASSMYFPEWIYQNLEQGDNGSPTEYGIRSEEEEIAKKMKIVGLWCIQSSPSNRPPMNIVVEMMEGSLEALEVPPMPVLQQIPAARLSQSFWDSGEGSSASEVLACSTK